MAADDAYREWSLTEEDEAFLMTELHPTETRLPMSVWVSQKEDARHDARIKVSSVHGGRMRVGDASVVAIRPQPRLRPGSWAPMTCAE